MSNLLLLLFLAAPIVLFIVALKFVRQARRSTPIGRRVLIKGNVSVLLLFVSLLILGGEIYFRFIYDATDSFGISKTTEAWFERHFQRNQTGFRDNITYQPSVEIGLRRLTFVGDSFTVGHGIPNVDDRFANIIRKLQRRTEVHVLAECGWDTGDHLKMVNFLRPSGYEIDVVILVYCLNDIADIHPEWQQVLKRIYEAPEPGFLAKNSYLFNTLHARLRMAQEPDIANYYDFVKDAYAGPVWVKQQQRLKEISRTVRGSGGRLLVVTFPFLHALGDDYAYFDAHQQLADFWDQQQVPHLDLLSLYQSDSTEDYVISTRDVHPNEFAHRLAADAVMEFVDSALSKPADKAEFVGPERSE
ncbi:MAG: hypothetical protein Fues2KO_20560 [Fuerstiella sp.]